MRIFGFLTIIVGLLIAFGYPSYHSGFTNFEIGQYTIYEKSDGYEEQTIWLAPDDAPIEVSFSADAESAASEIAILVEIQNGATIVRTDTIEFSAQADDTSAPETGVSKLAATLANFEIGEGALYKFIFKYSGGLQNAALNNITMTVTGIAVAPSDNVPTIGYALIGFGALVYLVGGRRRSKRVGNAPSGKRSKTSQIGRRAEKTPPPAEKPKKSSQKWGRDADS